MRRVERRARPERFGCVWDGEQTVSGHGRSESTAWAPHVVGFDDAPFRPGHRGDVLVVGTVYAGHRLQGVLSGRVRCDGVNSTEVVRRLVECSRFRPQLHALLLQGIAFAGFNVVDLGHLSAALGLPVLAVSRRKPDLEAIRRALVEHVPGGRRKWRLLERAPPIEPLAEFYVQRIGLDAARAESMLRALTFNGKLPEPLRVAHLIAGGIAVGESRHRA